MFSNRRTMARQFLVCSLACVAFVVAIVCLNRSSVPLAEPRVPPAEGAVAVKLAPAAVVPLAQESPPDTSEAPGEFSPKKQCLRT